MPIVHGGVPSPFVKKVCAFLAEKGVAYELRALAPFPKTPELLAMNPLGKIPIYQDGELTLPDSSAICASSARTRSRRCIRPIRRPTGARCSSRSSPTPSWPRCWAACSSSA